MIKKPRVSNHHGALENQNNLASARLILDTYADIDIMEIDFICHRGDLISMHDYTATGVINGSRLFDWIQMVVVEYGHTLWIDLKPKWDLVSLFCETAPYETHLLMSLLVHYRSHFLTHHGVDIVTRLMIATQDDTLAHALHTANESGAPPDRWIVSRDVPFLWSYVARALLPLSTYDWINRQTLREFQHYDFSHSLIISLDMAFFEYDTARLVAFIRENGTIRRDAMLILYSFPLSQAPIVVGDYHVVMQYDHPLPIGVLL